MEYNKTQFSKTSDKKVLHKVRKHWVVLSTALLMALGGGAALTGGTTSANADANANSNNNNTNASSTNTLKSRLNASLTKGYQANQANNTPKSVNVNQVSSKALTNQASALHNRILANATNASQNRQSTTNGRQASQNNGNNNEGAVLNNRIKASVNAPQVGVNYNAPVVGNPTYKYNGQLPITIAYINSAKNSNGNYHNVQYKDNGSELIPKIQQKNVPVYGNNVNSDYNQTLQYSAPDGYKFVGNSTPTVNYHIGNDDGTVTYTWNNSNTMVSDKNQNNNTYGTTINSDADWDKVNNRPLILLEPSEPGKNIIVNYVDQNGTPLDGQWGTSTNSDTISDIDNQPISNAYGDVIDVTKQGSNSHGIQNGIPQPNSTKNNYILDRKDTKVNYSVTNDQQNITIPLKGKTFAENSSTSDQGKNNVNVNIYIKNNKGQYLNSSNTWQNGSAIYKSVQNHYLHGQIGSKTLVTPDDDWIKNQIPNASRYSDDSGDSNQYISFKGLQDGNGVGNGLASISDSALPNFNSNHTINFTYDTNATDTADEKAAGFSVKYIDQAGNVIGPNGFMNRNSDAASYSDSKVSGKYGDSINVLNTDSTDNNGITGVQPEGYNAGNPSAGTYSLDPDQDVNYTINSDNYGNNDEQKNTQYYYFTGNQVATNANGKYPLKVQMNITYYQTPNHSNGYSVNTLDTTQGTNGLVTKSDSNVNVSDLVGNTHVLNASNFINEIPHKGSDQVQPNSKNNHHNDDNDSDVTSANLRFNPNGQLDVTKPSNDNRTLNYNSGTHTLTFNYDVYENVNQTAQHKIYVHYVTPSDPTSDITTVYNSDGSKTNVAGKTSHKPDGTPITIANTTVSDSGYNGETFNNHAVEESDTGSLNNGSNKGGNVPRGYQFIKVLGDNPIYTTSDDHTLSYHFSGWQGNKATNGIPKADGTSISKFTGRDQNEVIEVVPKVQGVTVNYVDQKGKAQKTIFISGNDARGYSRYGKTIDLANGHYIKSDGSIDNSSTNKAVDADDISKSDSISVPKGYHIANNNSDASANSDSKVETTDYLFNTPGKASLHGNVYNVMIAGNNEQDSASDVATIHIHEENPAGKVVHSYDVNDNINGDVNDPYTINAANFTPDGYVENPSNQIAQGTILPNGLSNRDINFYYKLNSTINYQQLSDIFVTYYHNGKQIGMNTITPQNGDYDNESVNVQDRSQFVVPSGYDLIGGQNTISKFQYHQPNYLNLNVYDPNSDDSNQVYADFTLQQKLYNHSGDTQPAKTLYHIIPESGKAGSGFSISANNYQVNGYKETANSPLSGTITNNGLNPDEGTIDYVATNSRNDNGGQPSQGPSDIPSNNHGSNKPAPKNNSDIPGGHDVSPDEHIAMPIYVQYWNKGNKIGSDQRVDGYMDQTFSDISKSTNVPTGYHLAADGQRLSYTIGTKEQQVNLQVNQNSANHKDAPFTLKIDEEDSNGQNAHQVATRNLTISDNTKDEISPDDYNPDSADYNVDTSNGKDGVLTLDNQDGTIKATGDNATASSATFYYKAINNDANLAPINVMYINQNGSQVGYHTFNGTSDGQKIDVNNPSNGGYLPTGYSDDTSKTPKDDYVTFGDVTQNTVVFVTGKQETEPLTIDYTLYTINDGNISATNGSQSNVNLNGYVGDVTTETAGQALSAIGSAGSGYQVDPNDPDDQPKHIHFNDNSIDPNTVHFNFYRTQSPVPDAAGNLYINFVTRDGHVVGHGTIYGKTQGTYVSDIASSNQGGVNPPHGYHVDTTVYPKYPHDNALKYTFKGTQNNKASVVVDPDTANSYTLTINRIMIDNNGHHFHDTWPSGGYKINLGNGDVTHIDPSLFTPTGYHVDPDDGSATVTVTSNKLNPNAVTFVYDQNKINDASDMIVRYFNQRGQFVKEDRISGANNFGKPIDVLDRNNDDANITGLPAGIGLPAHYSLAETGPNSNPNQRTHYVFDGSQHVINLNVQGEKLTAPLTVHIHENGGTDSVISGRISSNDGSDFLISPNGSLRGQNFTPQGYHATYSDQPQNVQMGTDGNGNGKLTPSSITFNYDADNQQAAPLTVIYLNQAGNKVGYSDVINGTLDEKINDVRNSTDGGEPIPAGYQPAPDQVWSYHLTSKPQTVYLHVIGNQLSPNENHLTIYRIMHNADGSMSEDYIPYSLSGNSDLIGDSAIIDPSADNIQPNKSYNEQQQQYNNTHPNDKKPLKPSYHPSSSDESRVVKVNSDGSLTPNQITFNYYAGDQAHAGIIWVHYINQNHRQVGATKEFTSDVGHSLLSSTISSNDHVPFGYTVDSGQPASYVYENAPQNININVSGDQVTSKPFTIYVVERDQSGKFINATPHTLKYTGRVGDTLTVSPYDTINSNGQLNGAGGTSLTPSDSHADSSDQPVTVHINANHDFVPQNSATFAYTKNSLAQSIGQITVHYGTDSNPNDSNPHKGNGTWTDVDTVTDHGIVGSSKFILNPYEDDVPDEINDSYAIANNGNGVMANGQNVTGYKDGNQDIYIRVVKVN